MFVFDHLETVTSTSIKRIVQYKHKLAYDVYYNNKILIISSNHNVKGYGIYSGFQNKRICFFCITDLFAWWEL